MFGAGCDDREDFHRVELLGDCHRPDRNRGIDSTTLGLLAKLSILSRQKVGLLPTVVTTNPDISRLLQSMGFDQVFNIVDRPIPCPECLTDLPSQDQNEDVVRSKVLEAHKILMGLNDSNREAFHDLVNALERT